MREPHEIRADCAAKLEEVQTSGMFKASLACLLDEDWTTPRIEEPPSRSAASCPLLPTDQ